jgi:F-type H+-transporting ATPase subunit delta
VPSDNSGTANIAGRYATALFQLAEADNQLDAVAADLAQLRATIEDSDDLKRLIGSPVVTRHDQGRVMTAIIEKAGLSDLVRRFVGLVAQNRRLFVLQSMINAFLAALAAQRGETSAQVISAQALSEKQKQDLEAVLKETIGNQVTIDAQVDPTLLGGMVVKVGSCMVDSSLKTKLQQLKLAMMGVG